MKNIQILLICLFIASSLHASPYDDLVKAINKNNPTELERSLAFCNIDLDTRDKLEGNTLLLYAIEQGKVDTVLPLIKAGANVNKADDRGFTPLMKAITSNLTLNQLALIIDEIIHAGANINQLAVEEDDDDPDTSFADGSTALMHAAGHTNPIMLCSWLIKRGADHTIINYNGDDARDYLKENRYWGICGHDRYTLSKILANDTDMNHKPFIEKHASLMDKIIYNARIEQEKKKAKFIQSKYQYVRNRELGRSTSKTQRTINRNKQEKLSIISE
jgi:ankyrin repeat protein